MKVIIPAAGIGKRLRPQTITTPKILMNVGGRPVISHIIDSLLENGLDDITVVIGHGADKVVKFLTEKYGSVVKTIRQVERTGSGPAVGLALDSADPALIILGNKIIDFDLEGLLSRNENQIGIIKVIDPSTYCNIVEKDNKVVSLEEQPKDPVGNLISSGIYYIQNQDVLKQALERITAKRITREGKIHISDAIQEMIDSGETVGTFPIRKWYDCGRWNSILYSNKALLDRDNGNDYRPEGSIIIEPCYISPTAEVINSVIGPHVTLDDGAKVTNTIVSNSVIGKEACLKHSSLKNSLIGENAAVIGNKRKMNVGDYSEIKFY